MFPLDSIWDPNREAKAAQPECDWFVPFKKKNFFATLTISKLHSLFTTDGNFNSIQSRSRSQQLRIAMEGGSATMGCSRKTRCGGYFRQNQSRRLKFNSRNKLLHPIGHRSWWQIEGTTRARDNHRYRASWMHTKSQWPEMPDTVNV